ncbi:zinc finger protein 184-like [Engraulis encrasicolus]|uniref:zinc finger protein 184-like n=1 Tax=Engraulis encrasicolus TaxID=184585 RepID=UPI002FD6AA1B
MSNNTMNCPAFRDELGTIMRILSEVAVEEIGRLLDESSSAVLPLEKAHPGTTSTLKRDLQREFKAKLREFALFMEVLSTSAADKVMILAKTLKFQWQDSPTLNSDTESDAVESWFEFEGDDQERTGTENPDHQEGTNADLPVEDTDAQKSNSLQMSLSGHSNMIGKQRQMPTLAYTNNDTDIDAEPGLQSHPTTLHFTDPLWSGPTSVKSWFEIEAEEHDDQEKRTGTENPEHQEGTSTDLPVQNKAQPKNSHVCDVCDKRFRLACQLRTHSYTHTGTRPFICELCGRDFSSTANLKRHQEIHSGLKPYACTVCSKTFSTSDGLRQHRNVHKLTKTLLCSTCGKAFSNGQALRTHAYIHLKLKPFACMVCGKGFRSRSVLNQHMKVHSVERRPKQSVKRSTCPKLPMQPVQQEAAPCVAAQTHQALEKQQQSEAAKSCV